MRLLLDENLSPTQSAILREQGHEAVVEVGLSGQPDEKIREFAIAENRVLLSLDSRLRKYASLSHHGNPWRDPLEDSSAD